MRLKLVFCILAFFFSAASHADSVSCNLLFTSDSINSSDVARTIEDLSRLQIKVDLAQVEGQRSTIQQTLKRDLAERKQELLNTPNLSKPLSEKELNRRIREDIVRIQRGEGNINRDQKESNRQEKDDLEKEFKSASFNPKIVDSIPDAIWAEYSRDGKEISIISRNKEFRLIDANSFDVSFSIELPDYLPFAAVTPDGGSVIMDFTLNRNLRLDLKTRSFKKPPPALAPYGRIRYSPDGQEAYMLKAGEIAVQNVKTGRIKWTLPMPDGLLENVMVNSDRSRMYVVTLGEQVIDPVTSAYWHINNQVHVIELKTHKKISSFKLNNGVLKSAVDPSGRFLVTGNYKDVFVIDLQNGNEVHRYPLVGPGLDHRVVSLKISPDGRLVFIGSWDRQLRIIGVPEEEILFQTPMQGVPINLTLSPNGQNLLVNERIDEKDLLQVYRLYGSP